MKKSMNAYNVLRDLIFCNRIVPGERIYFEHLSEELNISITPLREALNRLVQEGLISHDKGRGYILRLINTNEIEQMYELSEALEIYAMDKAIQKVTETDLNELKDNLARYKVSIEDGSTKDRLAVNIEFHLKIAKLSGNEIIVQKLNKNYEMITWKWKLENLMLGRGKDAYGEHMAIYDAIEKRDVANAIANLRRHISMTKNSVLKVLKEKEALFASKGF